MTSKKQGKTQRIHGIHKIHSTLLFVTTHKMIKITNIHNKMIKSALPISARLAKSFLLAGLGLPLI